jgi:hypothetical protein
MRGAAQTIVNPRNLELLARLLYEIPDDSDGLVARHAIVSDVAYAFDPARDPLAASLQRCLATLRARAEATRKSVHIAPPPTETLPTLAFHASETIEVPEPESVAQPSEARTVETAAQAMPISVHWSPDNRLLYEDVVRLFDLGDSAGAMISLERLVMLSPSAEELKVFLDKNGDLLLKLYRESLGSMDRVPVPLKDRSPIKIPTDHHALLMDVLRLADGHRTLRDMARKSPISELRTLVVISHLARSGFVEIA